MTNNTNNDGDDGNGNGLKYGGHTVFSINDNSGQRISAEEHLEILGYYDAFLRDGRYDEIERFESERKVPSSVLNRVLLHYIWGNGRDLDAKKQVIERFRRRGITERLLEYGEKKPIKSEEAKG